MQRTMILALWWNSLLIHLLQSMVFAPRVYGSGFFSGRNCTQALQGPSHQGPSHQGHFMDSTIKDSLIEELRAFQVSQWPGSESEMELVAERTFGPGSLESGNLRANSKLSPNPVPILALNVKANLNPNRTEYQMPTVSDQPLKNLLRESLFKQKILELEQSYGSSEIEALLREVRERVQHQLYGFAETADTDGSSESPRKSNAVVEAKVIQLKPTLLLAFQPQIKIIQSLAYSPDGRLLLSAGTDVKARIWRVSDGVILQEFSGHRSWLNGAEFSPDGELLITVSDDSELRLWRVADGSLVHVLGGRGLVSSGTFSPDGQYIIGSSEIKTEIILWRASDGKRLFRFKPPTDAITKVVFSPSGESIAASCGDGVLRVWSLAQLLGGDPNGHFNGPTPGARSATIPRSATSGFTGRLIGGVKGSYSILDFFRGQWSSRTRPQAQFQAHRLRLNDVAYSPDGKLLATASEDGEASLWRTSDGTILHRLIGHSRGVTTLAFSRDGKMLATGSEDKTVKFWDTETGRNLDEIASFSDRLSAVRFSPDGKFLATVGWDSTIKIWTLFQTTTLNPND